jgi:hypothetical protein
MGLLGRLFHISEDWLVEHYPGEIIALTIVIGLWIYAAKRQKAPDLLSALKLGSVALILFTFSMKYSWVHPYYYLAPGLILLISDRKKVTEQALELSPRSIQWIIGCIGGAHLLLFLWLQDRVACAYDFPAGTEKCFSIYDNADAPCELLDLRNADSASPRDRLKAGRSYGWVNSQFGHQFWILTPPGHYVSTICDVDGNCHEQEDLVLSQRAMGLRIPFLVQLGSGGGVTVTKGNPSDIGIGHDRLRVRRVQNLSVRRLR